MGGGPEGINMESGSHSGVRIIINEWQETTLIYIWSSTKELHKNVKFIFQKKKKLNHNIDAALKTEPHVKSVEKKDPVSWF